MLKVKTICAYYSNLQKLYECKVIASIFHLKIDQCVVEIS